MRELNVAAETHGRVLVEEAPAGPLLLLAGFHGYGQNADEMMDMLRAVPVGRSWTRVSVQALHRFYRRSEVTVASWMTRQDRETLIADNVQYVDAAIDAAAGARAIERLVLCGFSQGAAMAYRAAVLGARWPDAVIGVCGDVPPELFGEESPRTWPRVLLARGARDDYFTEEKMRANEASLVRAGAYVETFTFDAGHEWTAECAARAADFIASSCGQGMKP
jgi:predicted esterase